MNNEPDYASYVRCMEEVKRRLGAIDDILVGNKTTSYKYNYQFVALQFRKIFELIILEPSIAPSSFRRAGAKTFKGVADIKGRRHREEEES